MTVRSLAPNTEADEEIRHILDLAPTPSFTVTAGAGSGKTTSLVKALSYVVSKHEERLRARTQQVACITYTEVAAEEIFHETGSHPLIHVSTIHSFLWKVISPFQQDIGQWVQKHLADTITKLELTAAGGSPKKAVAAAETKKKCLKQLAAVKTRRSWTYGMGPDYARGVVGHSDIISMVPELLTSRPLLRKVVASRYPYIFVDESQDTDPRVLEGLIRLQKSHPDRVCLAFFGDPMQRIHFGSGSAMPVEDEWQVVEKPQNFRSSTQVLKVINRIRAGADGLQQVCGLSPERTEEGEAFFFVLPSDGSRTENLNRVREWLDKNSTCGKWTGDPPGGAKILLIMHKLAARRLGFGTLHAAFHQPDSRTLGAAFDEGSAWPLTPLLRVILPLYEQHSDVVPAAVIRKNGDVLSDESLISDSVAATLKRAGDSLRELRSAATEGGPGSIGRILRIAYQGKLVSLDPRLESFLDGEGEGNVELAESTASVLRALMECDVRELDGYMSYISRSSPYSTQHGTKGAEFPRVIVVLDDNEEAWHQYSYEKLFGLRPLSATDRSNLAEGKDTVIDRTRRLLYVCASRAKLGLSVVLYVANVAEAVDALSKSGYFSNYQIRTLDDLR